MSESPSLAPLESDAATPDASPEPAIATEAGVFRLSVHTLFRRPVFAEPEAARAVARAQGDARIWGRGRCLAWALLPDAWHGLVVVAAGDTPDALMRRFKGISARAVERRFRVNGWLWARGLECSALGVDDPPRQAARALVALPLRAGLAASLGEYPYWDAVWLECGHEP